MKDFELLGKSEQASTNGLNLFNYKDFVDPNTYDVKDGSYYRKYLQLKPNTKYTATVFNDIADNSLTGIFFIGATAAHDSPQANGYITAFNTNGKHSVSFNTGEDGRLVMKALGNATKLEEKFLRVDLIISEGNEIPYEPYTGGKPSPSPEYPQEIKNVGKWNEVTQKYEVDVKVTNAKESWDKEQTLTLTSDRPITKWDKLVEQDGQIGWLYQSAVDEYSGNTSLEIYETGFYFLLKNKKRELGEGYCKELIPYVAREDKPSIAFNMANNSYVYVLNTQATYGSTVSDIKNYLKTHPLHLVYKTETTEFVPLPQSEQDAIRTLKTYYPTTVITTDGGKANPDVEVTYIADTKNYIDQKIASVAKTVVETQKALL